jgi:hypothetical protein
MERQLKEHAIEAHRVRVGLEDEIKRLTALLSQAAEPQERMRREHVEAMGARDQGLRQAEERHPGQEKRMLAEVDRARQAAKALEAELAKEQQRRARGEEAAAKRLEAELEKLHQVRESARSMEAEMHPTYAELNFRRPEEANPIGGVELWILHSTSLLRPELEVVDFTENVVVGDAAVNLNDVTLVVLSCRSPQLELEHAPAAAAGGRRGAGPELHAGSDTPPSPASGRHRPGHRPGPSRFQ